MAGPTRRPAWLAEEECGFVGNGRAVPPAFSVPYTGCFDSGCPSAC
jgi:hypothetical protein